MSIKKNVSDIPQRKALGILSSIAVVLINEQKLLLGYLMDISDRR
jgi:hypothetical protein